MPAFDPATLTKFLLLALGLIPLAVENLRTGNISAKATLWLTTLGLVWIGVSHAAGWSQGSLAWQALWSFGVFLAFFFAFANRLLGGGAAKALAALSLWFSVGSYIGVIMISMFLTASVAKLSRRDSAGVGAPILVASLLVAAF